jgi:anti-sigma factor RsiW
MPRATSDMRAQAETVLVTAYPAGWTCDLIVVRLERYLLGTLAWTEALAVAEHIEACMWCAERIATLLLIRDAGAGTNDRQRTAHESAGETTHPRREGKRKGGRHDA